MPNAILSCCSGFREFLGTFNATEEREYPPSKKPRLSEHVSQLHSTDDFISVRSVTFQLRYDSHEHSDLTIDKDCHYFFHWTQPDQDKPHVLQAWDFRNRETPIMTLEIDTSQPADWSTLSLINHSSYFFNKSTKNLPQLFSQIDGEAYCVRSRFFTNTHSKLLTIDIAWRDDFSIFDLPKQMTKDRSLKVFKTMFGGVDKDDQWSPQDFYENAYVPPKDSPVSSQINDALICSLYPYQKRTIQFMLDREFACLGTMQNTSNGNLDRRLVKKEASYQSLKDTNGKCFFVSTVLATCTRQVQPHSVRGGILAEEMGLGKTLELITLITLHKRPRNLEDSLKKHEYQDVQSPLSKATLIVTPKHLLDQWNDELSIHAPDLLVQSYKGQKVDNSIDENADVVLTTYDVLSKEFWYVQAQKDHGLRHQRRYAPQVNALTGREWWRVCLDEAQMIDQGVSQSAMVANQIPRVNSWAISGTPFRQHVEDLRGLLQFLKYEPFFHNRIWKRVDKQSFKEIVNNVAVRHSKDKIRNELHLPLQQRIAITIPFMALEEQNYTSLFEQMCIDCGFNPEGSFLNGTINAPTWQDSAECKDKMRIWLQRLRQTCLHPHVGRSNRRALHSRMGGSRSRTVNEVLNTMIKTHVFSISHRQRLVVEAIIHQGHVFAYHKPDKHRSNVSLTYYQRALEMVNNSVKLCQENQNSGGGDDVDVIPESLVESSSSRNHGVANMKQQLRLALELQHCCYFHVATAYYNIKENTDLIEKDSKEFKRLLDLENSNYDHAKLIRRNLLTDARKDAEEAMKCVENVEKIEFDDIWLPDNVSGLENVRLMEQYVEIVQLMNKQVVKIIDWRDSIIKNLSKPLIDTDEDQDLTGEEYEESTESQNKVNGFFDALKIFVADRSTLITGIINTETKDDIKRAKAVLRNDYVDLDASHPARIMLDLIKDRDDVQSQSPIKSLDGEHGILWRLRTLQNSLEIKASDSELAKGTRTRVESELSLISQNVERVTGIVKQETSKLEKLKKQIDIFRSCMNERLTYYRRLQNLSDMVQPYKEHLQDEMDQEFLNKNIKNETDSLKHLKIHEDKLRFLNHLKETASEEKSKECIICRDSIEAGMLTVCGHQFCKDCLKSWFSRSRSCPICKRALNWTDLQAVTYRTRQIETAGNVSSQSSCTENEESAFSDSQSSRSPQITSTSNEVKIYSAIDSATLFAIQSIPLERSYSTKVDTVLRTLLYLRRSIPGSKSLIYSHFTEFLSLLAFALADADIKALPYHTKGAARLFRTNPDIEVLLLDAKSDASGLNLTCATNVFLCEPLLNPGLEVQAVARVHRIGQMKETKVWMILIRDTVEEAVYRVACQRRASFVREAAKDHKMPNALVSNVKPSGANHVMKGAEKELDILEATIHAANSKTLESKPISSLMAKKGGGERVEDDDLWKCLFDSQRSRKDEDQQISVQDLLSSPSRTNGVIVPRREDVDRIIRAEAAESR